MPAFRRLLCACGSADCVYTKTGKPLFVLQSNSWFCSQKLQILHCALKHCRWCDEMVEHLRYAEKLTSEDESVGQTRLHELPDAGHWVHVDNPSGLLRMVAPSFKTALAST